MDQIALSKFLFENNPQPMWIYDIYTLCFLEVNNAAIAKYGYSRDEFSKMTIKDIRPHEDVNSLIEDIQQSSDEINISKNCWRHKFKSGEIIYVEINSHRLLYNGKESRLVIANEITELLEAKAKTKLLSKLSAAVNESNSSVIITDENGSIEYVNPAYTKISGFDIKEVTGRKPSITKSHLHSDKFYSDLWETILSGKSWRGEIANKNREGKIFWENVTIAPILDDKGKISNFVAIKDDITTQKQLIEDLINAKNRAEESDRIKTRFLATMSHELRTPLNAIIGFSDLLSDDLTKDDIDSYATTINKSGRHLLSLIEELFDISLIESGQIKLNYEDVELADLINQIFAVISREQKLMGRQSVKLCISTPSKSRRDKTIISTDQKRLKQILVNLLKNALKFTEKGSIEYGYELIKDKDSDNDSGLLKFFVKDSGIGIPKEKLNLIFEEFQQGDTYHTKAFAGAGLGLAIAKKLVESLGGKIWVESEENRGSIFNFTLPLKKKNNFYKIEEDNIVNERIYDFSGISILLAEDDDPSFLLIKAIMKKTNIDIFRAKTGSEALKIVQNNEHIALVLMDINMPDMNGYEATREIKKLKPDIPVVAQTAYSISGDREKILDSGFDDYISKPIKKEDLYNLIERFTIK